MSRFSTAIITLILCAFLSACSNDVTCPTPKQDANKMFENASKGKSTQKKKTKNGLIKKKNPNNKKKKR